MNKKQVRLTALFALLTGVVIAQEQTSISIDEIVVSDTKFAQPKEKSGKIISAYGQRLGFQERTKFSGCFEPVCRCRN